MKNKTEESFNRFFAGTGKAALDKLDGIEKRNSLSMFREAAKLLMALAYNQGHCDGHEQGWAEALASFDRHIVEVQAEPGGKVG